jgi:multiple sugar transport system substrate-binding protein
MRRSLVAESTSRATSRRRFLRFSGLVLAASAVAACSQAAPSPTSAPQATAPTAAPTATAAQPTTAPASAATSTAAVTPTAASAAAPQPTTAPQAQPTVTPASGAVTLNYWDMQWGGAPFMNQIQDNVTAFNKANPKIYVKFTQLSWGDYTQKILSATQAGTPPDMSGGDSGIPFVMDAQGQALDISDLYKDWQSDGTFDDMVPWAYQKWDYKGKHPGITWQFDARAIFYRKDLLQQAGVEVPTQWDPWALAAQKTTDTAKGIIGMAVPGKQGSYDTDQFYMTLVFQAGGGLADAAGNPTFDTPEQLKALTFEKTLVGCCASKGTPSWTFTEVLKNFEQEKAAMAFGGGWFIGDIQKNAPQIFDKVGVLPVLIGPGGEKAQHCVSFANPWMIYSQSKHHDEAKTFLKFSMQKENLRKLYAADPGNKWPVYKSLLSDPIYQANDLIKTLAEEVVKYGIDYWYPNNAAAVGIASLGTGIADIIVNPVLAGARQPEDALKDAQTKLGQLFKQKM